MGKVVGGVQKKVFEGQLLGMVHLLAAAMAEVAQQFLAAIGADGCAVSFRGKRWL
jgi:hypothetical protein